MLTLALIACTSDPIDTTPQQEDSGTGVVDVDTAPPADTAGCPIAVSSTDPLYGNTKWYYRDPVEIGFSDEASDAVSFSMTGDDGDGPVDVPLIVTWDESKFNATIEAEAGTWSASTSYLLSADFCDAPYEVVFSTTEYGAPLTIDNTDLIDNAYYLDMSRATYTQPAGVGVLLSLFLSEPLLLGVLSADADSLELIAAPGTIDSVSGAVTQNAAQLSWDFGTADFTTAPYFTATGDTLFIYDEVEIPVHDFTISGTFSPGGSSIGGAEFIGLGDTRNMGPLLQIGNDKDSTCSYLSKFGVTCEACPDGEEVCLTLAGRFETANILPDVTLEEIAAEEKR